MIFDESKVDNNNPEKEAMENDIGKRWLKIFKSFRKDDNHAFLDVGPEYTFTDHLGYGDLKNTNGACYQLVAALALRNNPEINELTNERELNPEDIKRMVDDKVLSDLKILDLGCGSEPTFARVARQMGAKVYTVDEISSDKFYANDKMPKEMKDEERQYHITLDLYDPNATEKIRQISGGDFDMTTESYLNADLFTGDGEKISLPLIKDGGIYYKTSDANVVTVK